MPPSRHKINRVSKRGEEFDFSKEKYEIDDNLRVFSDGELLQREANQIWLYTASERITFGVIRLFLAVVFAIHPDVEKYSGVRVVNYDLPLYDGRRYAWETPSDRKNLRVELFNKIEAAEDSWKTVMHDGVAFAKYEIHNKTGKIRNKKTKKIRSATDGRVTLRNADGKEVRILVHRAYMYTFFADQRRPDQIHVDHINGESSDNSPWNLRWASRSENEMYKFTPYTKKKVPDKFTGNFEDYELKQFKKFYFGYDDGKYTIIDSSNRDMFRVGDFSVTDRNSYPTKNIDGKTYLVHRLVARAEGILTDAQLDDPSTDEMIMHLDNNKENFDPSNLRLGDGSDNQKARQENTATTGRKRVQQLDDDKNMIAEHDSGVAAAVAVGGNRKNLRNAIRRKHRHAGFYWKLA